jgi:hypothetical protein
MQNINDNCKTFINYFTVRVLAPVGLFCLCQKCLLSLVSEINTNGQFGFPGWLNLIKMEQAIKLLGRKLKKVEVVMFELLGNDKDYKMGIDDNGNLKFTRV